MKKVEDVLTSPLSGFIRYLLDSFGGNTRAMSSPGSLTSHDD